MTEIDKTKDAEPELSAYESMDVFEWMALGLKNGWVGPDVCDTHDGTPISEEEYDLADEENGYELPCIHILRLYPDSDTKAAVEAAHSPSTWRQRRVCEPTVETL